MRTVNKDMRTVNKAELGKICKQYSTCTNYIAGLV